MAALNVMIVDSADYKPSKAEILRGIITEKLTTAAQDILAVVERTVAGYEEEAAGFRQEIDRQGRQLELLLLQPQVELYVEDSERPDVFGHAEEEEGEDEEEPVQNTSPDQEDLRDPDYQITNTRGSSVKRKGRMWTPLNLRVCLLEDKTVRKSVSKPCVRVLRCPRGLQEPDFLNLLRSTFPQLTGQFDAFTADVTKKLHPLKVKTLTPEEIQQSIKSAGKGRSALYIQVKAAKEPQKREEQRPPKQRNDKDEATNYGNRPHEHSNNSPVDQVETNEADLSSNSRRQQQVETEEGDDGEQRGISDPDNFSAPSSARSAAESEGDMDDDRVEEDDDWKPDKNDEELSEAEPNSSKMTRKRQFKGLGVKRERRKRMQSSLKMSAKNSGAPLSCKVCRTLHKSTNMLIKHAWSHADDPGSLCGVCGEQSAEELRSHLQSHQKRHSCNICGKSFLTVVYLERHAVIHTAERPYKCHICHKAYTRKTALWAHRWEHVEEKPHKCDFCNQSFCAPELLRIHRRTHTGEKPYRCELCDKSFSYFRSLSCHTLTHTGEKRHGCRVCGKRFLTSATVKQHEKIHTDRDRMHLCHVCCKTFHTSVELRAHLKTHSREKIMCSECGKGLSSHGALRSHMLIHTGERPYKCSECGRAFNTSSILRAHLKTHSGVKPFVCGVCGKASARPEHLAVHMRTHNGERPYQCSVCDKTFTQSHCLKTHMRVHQGDEQSAVDGLKS